MKACERVARVKSRPLVRSPLIWLVARNKGRDRARRATDKANLAFRVQIANLKSEIFIARRRVACSPSAPSTITNARRSPRERHLLHPTRRHHHSHHLLHPPRADQGRRHAGRLLRLERPRPGRLPMGETARALLLLRRPRPIKPGQVARRAHVRPVHRVGPAEQLLPHVGLRLLRVRHDALLRADAAAGRGRRRVHGQLPRRPRLRGHARHRRLRVALAHECQNHCRNNPKVAGTIYFTRSFYSPAHTPPLSLSRVTVRDAGFIRRSGRAPRPFRSGGARSASLFARCVRRSLSCLLSLSLPADHFPSLETPVSTAQHPPLHHPPPHARPSIITPYSLDPHRHRHHIRHQAHPPSRHGHSPTSAAITQSSTLNAIISRRRNTASIRARGTPTASRIVRRSAVIYAASNRAARTLSSSPQAVPASYYRTSTTRRSSALITSIRSLVRYRLPW